MGSYNHEEEILLMDGLKFVVESVKDDTDRMGKPIVLITLKHWNEKTSNIGCLLSIFCTLFL